MFFGDWVSGEWRVPTQVMSRGEERSAGQDGDGGVWC